MNIAIACDHGGFSLKQPIIALLRTLGHQVIDLGAAQLDAQDDYPDFAAAAGEAVRSGKAERAIVICGSGVGASVAANKMKGVRAGLCHDTYSAAQGVEHDNINILCLGARVVGSALAAELVKAFVNARFSGEARHVRRLAEVDAIEARG
jgi:ribose 5-phosphate isomerase B